MLSERDQQIAPVVQDSVAHNTKVLAQLRALTASLFGIGAGILGLESYPGFLFYLFFSLLTSALIYVLRVVPGSSGLGSKRSRVGVGLRSGNTGGDTNMFFASPYELWLGGLVDGASGFVLTWTLAYGLVRA